MGETRLPAVGSRVSLICPPGTKNFPELRVGEVVSIHDGGFDVIVQPDGRSIRVDVENFVEHGASWRAWVARDGWPTPSRR